MTAVVAILLLFPELWFRSALLSAVLPPVLKEAGFEYRAQGLEARAKHIGPMTVRFEVRMRGLTLVSNDTEPHALETAFSEIAAQVEVRWPSIPPKITAFNEVRVISERVVVREKSQDPGEPPASAPSSPSTPSTPSTMTDSLGWLAWVEGLNLGQVAIRVPSIQVFSELGALTLDGQVHIAKERQQPLDVDAALRFVKQGLLSAKVSNYGCDSTAVECLAGFVKWDPLDKKAMRANVGFRLMPEEKRIRLGVDGVVQRVIPEVAEIRVHDPCNIAFDRPTDEPFDVELRCNVVTRFRLPRIREIPNMKLPDRAQTQVELTAQFAEATLASPFHGTLKVVSDPVLTSVASAALQIGSRFQGRLTDGLEGFHHGTELKFDFDIPEAAKVNALLAPTPWAIPAPVNNLRGPIRLVLTSTWKDWETEAPFELTTRLDSQEQAFQTHATGKLQFVLRPSVSARIDADWSLDNVRLAAPRLNLMEMPRLTAAPEIVLKPETVKTSPSAFHYTIRVQSPKEQPVRIDSNLVQDVIPIDVRAVVDDRHPVDLYLNIRSTPFEFFRRKGALERLEYVASEREKDGRIDGRARVRSGEYAVYAHFFGTSEKLRLELSSTPQAPEEDLWAILLFGAPLDALDMDQRDSAMATSRAVTQGAFGLLSLYVFASTPIERVNYDPVNERVTASFRIKEGLSFELGRSDESSVETGVTKRLGKGWRLKFQVSKNQAGEASGDTSSSGKAGAGVEWSTSY